MVAFLRPASGGIQPINGRAGGVIQESSNADRAKPGTEIIPDRKNIIEAVPPGGDWGPAPSGCDPQASLQRVKNSLEQKLRNALNNLIQQQVQEQLEKDPVVQNLTQQLQQLQQQEKQGVNVTQQVEIISKQLEKQIQAVVIPAALKRVEQVAPKVTQAVAQSAGNSLGQASQAIRTTIPQSVIKTNLSQRYGAQVVQAVRQGCSI